MTKTPSKLLACPECSQPRGRATKTGGIKCSYCRFTTSTVLRWQTATRTQAPAGVTVTPAVVHGRWPRENPIQVAKPSNSETHTERQRATEAMAARLRQLHPGIVLPIEMQGGDSSRLAEQAGPYGRKVESATEKAAREKHLAAVERARKLGIVMPGTLGGVSVAGGASNRFTGT